MDSTQGHVRERAILLVLASVQFISIVDFMIVMPMAPKLIKAMDLSPLQFGLVVSSYAFSASLAGILAALVVDRLDRRTAFLGLFAGFLVGTLLCGVAPTYSTLLAARTLTGAFGGVLGGLALTIVGDIVPEQRRGRATGTLMSAFAVASALGVPLGIVLSNRLGWHAPFLVLAAVGFLVLVVAARALPSLSGHLVPGGHGESPLSRFTAVLANPNHLRAYLLVTLLMIGGFSVIPFISDYLVANLGVTSEQLPLIYIVGGVVTLVAAPAVGRLADRFGKLRVYSSIAPISGVLMLAVTNLPRVSLAAAVGVVACLMASNAGRMVVAMAMVTSCVEPRRRGTFMSLNSSVQHLSSGLAAYLGGAILGRAADGSLTRFPLVGLLAFGATLLSLGVAASLRVAASGDRGTDIAAEMGRSSPLGTPIPEISRRLGADPVARHAREGGVSV